MVSGMADRIGGGLSGLTGFTHSAARCVSMATIAMVTLCKHIAAVFTVL